MIEDNIFLEEDYIRLYLQEDDEIFSFSYNEGDFSFKNRSIKSPINGTTYYDLSSPYGYSGYYANTEDLGFLQRAIKQQTQVALEQNIIAEFIRFHPLYSKAQSFQPFLDFFSQERLIVEVELDMDKRWENYGSKERNKMRKALKTFEVNESRDVENFYHLYCETMDKRNAQDFYYFSKEYFQKLLELKNTIMLESRQNGELHSMSIFLFDTMTSYYHLTANSTDHISQQSGATRSILEHFFQIAEKKNIKSCILGGGTTSNHDDSLFLFKKQFSPIIKPFFIGGKIYNHQVFLELKKGKENNQRFLCYRY